MLVSNAEFETLKAASPYPEAEGLRPEKIEWKPKTHLLAYSTVPMFMGLGYAPGKDMRVIDVDTLEATALWHIPADGSAPIQLGSISAIPFAWPDTAFSPNLDKVGYAKSVGQPEQNQRELHIANADGSGDLVFASGEGVEFWQWTPDGTRFSYAINGGPEQGAYLGQLSGGTTLIASVPSSIQQMRWVDPSRFLYLNPNGNILELRISDIDGSNHAFIDSISNSFTNYAFTQ